VICWTNFYYVFIKWYECDRRYWSSFFSWLLQEWCHGNLFCDKIVYPTSFTTLKLWVTFEDCSSDFGMLLANDFCILCIIWWYSVQYPQRLRGEICNFRNHSQKLLVFGARCLGNYWTDLTKFFLELLDPLVHMLSLTYVFWSPKRRCYVNQ